MPASFVDGAEPMSRIVPMSLLILCGGFAAALPALAQQPDAAELQRLMEQARGMNVPDAAQLQQLQQRALEMQSCMARVDQAELERLQQESAAASEEIRALCAAGQRDAAQARAITLGGAMAANPAVAELGECGRLVAGLLPGMVAASTPDGSPDATHVCDLEGAP